MAEKRGAPLAQAPNSPTRYQRGIFPEDARVSDVGRAIDLPVQALNPYPLNVETGERELAVPGLFEGIAAFGRGTAEAIRNPVSTAQQAVEGIGGFLQEQMRISGIRPGQLVIGEDGEMRQATAEDLSALDPTLGGTFAAPLITRGAVGGLEGLMPEAGVLTSGGVKGKSNVTLPGHNTPNDVVDLGVKFKSEHPAFKNMAVSYVEPVDPASAVKAHNQRIQDQIEQLQFAKKFVDPNRFKTFDDEIQELFDERISLYDTEEAQKEIGQIQRYVQTDNRTGTDALGIIRVTAPQDDIVKASGGKNTGPLDIGHDPLYTGGEGGLSPVDISRRKAAVDDEMDLLRAAIESGDVDFGVPKNLDLNSDEGKAFLLDKALNTVKQKELKGEINYSGPKNAPIGFARFADIEISGKPYMRLTEIQFDLFKETRESKKGASVRDVQGNEWSGGEDLPELYPNMKKDDKPLSSAVLKASVATAIERGSKGIVLPNSLTSDAGVRYSDSNVKKLLKKTIRDLGEGFSYRKVEVPSIVSVKFDDIRNVQEAIREGNQKTVTEHYVLEWSGIDEVPDEMKFANGGIVSLPPQPRGTDGIVDVIRKYRREALMD